MSVHSDTDSKCHDWNIKELFGLAYVREGCEMAILQNCFTVKWMLW
jgi:hypothetical protein